MSDKPLTEQEVWEMAEAITGGEGDDRDGWYGAAEARVLAHDWLRLQQRLAEAERQRQFAVDRADVEMDRRKRAERERADLLLELKDWKWKYDATKKALRESERERDEARAALKRIGNTLSIDTAWQIARDALEQE